MDSLLDLLPTTNEDVKSLAYSLLAALLVYLLRELRFMQWLRHTEKRRRIERRLEHYAKKDSRTIHEGEIDTGQSNVRSGGGGEDNSGDSGRASIFKD